MEEKKQQSIGALWIKKSKSDLTYLSGLIEVGGKKTQIVVFKNTMKEEDKQPDYRILESTPYKQTEVEGEGTDGVPIDSIPF